MNTAERDTIKKLISALEGVLKCQSFDPVSVSETVDSEELSGLLEKVNLLIGNLSEMNEFAMELCRGNMDAEPPGRRNYLSSYLKELHTQLSSLTWTMDQLIAGHMVGKLPYRGRLFTAFNGLIDKITTLSMHLNAGEHGGSAWDWSGNSWRYHQLLSALNNLRIMVLEVSSDGTIIYANKPASDYLAGLTALPSDTSGSDILIQHLVHSSREDNIFPLFREVYDKTTRAWFKVTSDRVEFVDGNTGYLHMIDDISEWKRNEKKLKNTATYDELTGVLNRRVGMQVFEEMAMSGQEPGYCAAFIDVDGLKLINDTYGHSAGDHAIKTIAGVLVSQARADDIVCRYGGDEFVVIFRNCSFEEAAKIMQRMENRLSVLNRQGTVPYRFSFSYGLTSVASGEAANAKDIIEKIDQEMYKNKNEKKIRMGWV